MSVGSKRCQSELALLLLKCHCLRQIEVNQICVRGVLLRALSLYSWQQWAHWWIAVLYVKQCVYVFKACVTERKTECDWAPVFQLNVSGYSQRTMKTIQSIILGFQHNLSFLHSLCPLLWSIQRFSWNIAYISPHLCKAILKQTSGNFYKQ